MKPESISYDFILAIDQGGHATRATIYNLNGTIETTATSNISTQRIDVAGVQYIQHNVAEIQQSVQVVLNECASHLGDTKRLRIKAGFATQRSTIVCWNYKTGEVLSDAISWQDTRAKKFIEQFQSKQTFIQQRTGLFLSAHYGVSKINWCLNNLDKLSSAKSNNELCIAPLSSYLIYSCVAGSQRLVDPANAARTLLFNQSELNWDQELLKLFSVPDSILPRCVTTQYDYGQMLNWDGVCHTKIITGDQSAAVFAQGVPEENVFIINIGSGAFVLNINNKNEAPARLLSGSIYTDNKLRINAWEGTINSAGTALDWLQNKNPKVEIYAKLPTWLSDYGGNIPLFINGISGIGSPYWMSSIESRFLGESQLAGQSVAVIESIVFLITINIELMIFSPVNQIKISGGLSIMDGLCQKISDLTNIEVFRTSDKEATSLGLLYLLSDKSSRIRSNVNTLNFEKFIPVKNVSLLSRFEYWKKQMAKLNENS